MSGPREQNDTGERARTYLNYKEGMGYYLKPGCIKATQETVQNFAERLTRLYEQGTDTPPALGSMFSDGRKG